MITSNIWVEKTNNTILLSVSKDAEYGEQYNEDLGSLSIYPGHLVREIETAAPVLPGHASKVGLSLCRTQDDLFSVLVAVENPYSGKTINDPYLLNERVMFRVLKSGDVAYVRIKTTLIYQVGAFLTISSVPGALKGVTDPVNEKAVAIAMEERLTPTSYPFIPARIL